MPRSKEKLKSFDKYCINFFFMSAVLIILLESFLRAIK